MGQSAYISTILALWYLRPVNSMLHGFMARPPLTFPLLQVYRSHKTSFLEHIITGTTDKLQHEQGSGRRAFPGTTLPVEPFRAVHAQQTQRHDRVQLQGRAASDGDGVSDKVLEDEAGDRFQAEQRELPSKRVWDADHLRA
jgi:hypothetical protein